MAEYVLVEVCLPGRAPEVSGVLLLSDGELHVRLRRDWLYFAGSEYFEVLDGMGPMLEEMARDEGGRAALEFLEDRCSHVVRLGKRQETLSANPESTLRRLYREYVRAEVLPFETHLPLYSLRAAATKFGPARQADSEPEAWLEVDDMIRMSDDLFAVRIVGRSMEPKIPDGSIAVFRAGVQGSRQGRIVLVEYFDGRDVQYTVKQYHSEKSVDEDGGWMHQRIELRPLNREFEAFQLKEGDELHVLGEFVTVLEE